MKLIIKETFITIKKSIKKFISILLIVLLGVGFFAGIKATSPDMKKTLNKYYQKTTFQDLELLSTWGVTKDEVLVLKDKGYQVNGYYMLDGVIKSETEEIAKIISFNDKQNLNKLNLIEGRLPQNDKECVIDASFKHNHKIGDTLTVLNENFKETHLKIVGTVKTPIYISLERGTTDLLTGNINYFIYSLESNFKMDYYTNLGIYLNEEMFTDKYKEKTENAKKDLEKITNEFREERYNKEKNAALKEYNEAKDTFEKEKKETNKKFDKAKRDLKKAKSEYNEGIATLNKEKENFEMSYETNLKDILNNQEVVNNNLNELYVSKEFLENQIINLEEQLIIIDAKINNTSDDAEIELLKSAKIELDLNLSNLNGEYNKLLTAENELKLTLKNLEENHNLLVNGKKTFEEETTKASKKLADAKREINDAEKEILKNEKKATKEFLKVEKELVEAYEDIEKLEKPEWYILDREANIGFYQYNQDIERIKNLGQVFPLVFFVVAVLICLTSMTRMVEEERNQLGTLKSLGFTNSQILFKYILYSLIATLIGSVIGLLIGFKLLPTVIFMMYQSMYNIGDLITEFNIYYAITSTAIALMCTIIATSIVCIKSLKEHPSELMRPKAIKGGKRIVLEKISFIWKRLDFNHKVTMRNVFRYKKRMLMTIVGISGCTGLIIAGFGLKDCLGGMVTGQYENVFKYDLEITLNDDGNPEKIITELKTLPEIKEIARVEKEAAQILNYNTKQQVQLIVGIDSLDNFIALRNRKNNQKITLNNVVISEKLANLLKIEKNDKLEFETDKKYTLKINDITENYLNHYIYINAKTYNSDKYNTLLINTKHLSRAEENKLATKINQIDGISKLTFTSRMAGLFEDTMNNFEYVVIVLIISANLLAFVVLYNLASVNMSERKRELATIKVLGFTDKEVFDYIGRETSILTGISMVFGVFLGKVLTTFIIKTCELDIMMFNPKITLNSYLYGIILTILFTLIVNITTYFALKKIEMVESLKSVE